MPKVDKFKNNGQQDNKPRYKQRIGKNKPGSETHGIIISSSRLYVHEKIKSTAFSLFQLLKIPFSKFLNSRHNYLYFYKETKYEENCVYFVSGPDPYKSGIRWRGFSVRRVIFQGRRQPGGQFPH
jgi:hypothetical protein